MKKLVKLPALTRVQPGNTALLELPLGPTYERVILDITAAAGLDLSDIGKIKCMLNSSEFQVYLNGQQLSDINAYWGREADLVSGTNIQLGIHFNRAEMADNIWRNAPGIGTQDVSTLTIEIDIPGTAPADIKIAAYAQVDPTRQPIGTFFRVRQVPFTSLGAGQVEIDKLLKGPLYAAIHLFKAGGDINYVELTTNKDGQDIKVIDSAKTILSRFQKAASPRGRVPMDAKATSIDFVTDGNLLDTLPTAGLSDFRIKMTLASAGDVNVVTETLDSLG